MKENYVFKLWIEKKTKEISSSNVDGTYDLFTSTYN